MEQVIYYVVFHRGEWKIEHDGHFYGPHRNQEAATKLAVAAAELAKRDGDSAMVIVQEKDNTWHTEYVHKSNPYAFAW